MRPVQSCERLISAAAPDIPPIALSRCRSRSSDSATGIARSADTAGALASLVLETLDGQYVTTAKPPSRRRKNSRNTLATPGRGRDGDRDGWKAGHGGCDRIDTGCIH